MNRGSLKKYAYHGRSIMTLATLCPPQAICLCWHLKVYCPQPLAAIATKVKCAYYQSHSQQGVHVAMLCDRTTVPETSALFKLLKLSFASDVHREGGSSKAPCCTLSSSRAYPCQGCSATMATPLCSAVLPALKHKLPRSSKMQPSIHTAASRCRHKGNSI